MSAASQIDGPAAKRGKLTEILDPRQPLKNYTKETDTQYSVEFEREVPGHGSLRFKLYQIMLDKDGKKQVEVEVQLECLDLDWRQIDDTCIRVFIRLAGDEDKYAVNDFVDPDDGVMCGCPNYVQTVTRVESLFCWIERCENNVGWNRFREIHCAPAAFRGPDGRFVLQAADGYKFYVHYSVLADWSPMLKRCMEANYDQIADGVPLKLECSFDVLLALLYFVYLNETRYIKGNICEAIAQANFLEMFGVVRQAMKIMRQELNNQSFERLFEWFECAAQYDLDNNKLEVEILKQLGVLALDDEENKELLQDQIKEYMKKNPDKVAELAFYGLFK